ncbi:leucine zipper protein 2 [Narcine bancroftii]|uniref:leucine zipper protein 2 n=1 Tax=Narcine bancroftii TaxID=1343680 RepID=UPI003831F514
MVTIAWVISSAFLREGGLPVLPVLCFPRVCNILWPLILGLSWGPDKSTFGYFNRPFHACAEMTAVHELSHLVHCDIIIAAQGGRWKGCWSQRETSDDSISPWQPNHVVIQAGPVHHEDLRRHIQGSEDLENKLKQISMEKSSLLQQLSKSATGLKGNLQSVKSDEAVAKNDVQKLLEISQKQKDEMKSLQESLQKQINEAALKAEKQQAGINFLKAEVERKSKLIKDLQQENKSLKNKLLSGNKQCGIHAEESKRIQSQLKELRYGKKDLIFKAQQLSDLERKLLTAKQELEKTEGNKESQLKALKEVARLCVSGVLKNQAPFMSVVPHRSTENGMLLTKSSSPFPSYQPSKKLLDSSQTENTNLTNKGPFLNDAMKSNDQILMDCSLHKVSMRFF